jgi:hypothetical protein
MANWFNACPHSHESFNFTNYNISQVLRYLFPPFGTVLATQISVPLAGKNRANLPTIEQIWALVENCYSSSRFPYASS